MTFEKFKIKETEDYKRLKNIMEAAFGDNINIDKHQNLDQDTIPNKPLFFLRSYYAVMFLVDPDNHYFLVKNNAQFIDKLFENIYKSLKQKIVVNHYRLIVFIMQFYMSAEPTIFVYNFLKYRLAHQLILNVKKPFVAEFLISLISPLEMLKCLPPKHLEIIWKDLKDSSFFNDLASVMLRGPQALLA